MADQRMIGDILSERRRRLGLSIDRVANDTKLQRRMVEAFEASDFDAMPPKGYAQASLASYARYLGLNPNDILPIYEDQLYEYERASSYASRGDGRRGRSSREPVDGRRRSSRDRYDDDPYGDAYPQRDARYDRRSSDRRDRPSYDDYDDYRGRRASRDMTYESEGRRSGYGSSRSSTHRGLYDDLYDAPSSSRSRARSSRYDDTRRYDNDYEDRFEDRYDSRDGYGYGARPSGRPSSRDRRGSARGETQVVTLDDGYQGGSGGRGGSYGPDPRPRTRHDSRPPQSATVSDYIDGFLAFFRENKTITAVIVGAIAVVLIVVIVVGVTSCVRGRANSDGDGTIPVTPVSTTGQTADQDAQQPVQTTELAPSIDLNALPADSKLTISVAEDAVAPWVEVYIDGTGVYAGIPSAANGDLTREYTVTQSAQVNLSSIDGVTITVNDVAVTPVVDNATYTLSMTVVQPAAEGEGETGDGTGEGDASGDQAAPAEGEAQDVPAEGEGSEQPVA